MLVRVREILVDPAHIIGVCCLNTAEAPEDQVCSILMRNGKTIVLKATMSQLSVELMPLIKKWTLQRVTVKS